MTPKSIEFNGVVRLTSLGTAYLLLTVTVGFAAINTGNNSLFIGLAFMLGVLLLSGLASKGGLKGIEIGLVELDEAWASEPTPGLLVLHNRSKIWSVRDIVLIMPELEGPVFIPILPRRAQPTVPATFLFPRRGRIELTKVDLYTRYPFALFVKKRRVRMNAQTVVFPRLLSRRERHPFTPVEGDFVASNRIGPGAEIFAFRDYVRGDSLRQLHWKKTASLGRWIIKQSELDANRSVQIALDPWLPPGVSEERFEEMISAAATMLNDALTARIEVVLSMPGIELRGSGAAVRRPMFEALALVAPVRKPVEFAPRPDMMLFSLRGDHESQTA